MVALLPAASNPLKHLPRSPRNQSGFISSTLTLALVLAVLLAIYLLVQRQSRPKDRRPMTRGRTTPVAGGAEAAPAAEEDTHLLDGVEYRESRFFWDQPVRYSLMAGALIIFAINIFSIVASSISEPIMREPKFWLLKVVAIPAVLVVLFAQLFMTPTKQLPAQINHTLVLLLTLILLVLAPIFTAVPVDADHGRLSLARKWLEHIAGPAALVAGLVGVHRVVYELLEHEVTQPPSADLSGSEGSVSDDGEYVYEDDTDGEDALEDEPGKRAFRVEDVLEEEGDGLPADGTKQDGTY